MEKHEQQIFLNNILANTLHEVRTPIQTIIGTLELLSDTKLNNEQTEYIRQIQFSADVLLTLANNVLDFSKIQSNEFKLESINYDVYSLVEQVTDFICIEAFNKGLEVITDIAPDVPQYVIGDPTRVQQILLNLLKNAVKFTGKGHIHCSLSCKEQKLLFEVKDTGIGLSEETSRRLFTSFFQGDASISRKYGGTGLGLSISKSLTKVMNGEIGAEGKPGEGSCFWFTIPIKEPEKKDFQVKQLNYPQTRFLVVDNDEIACKSLAGKIKKCGLSNISLAYSGKEALALIEISQKNNQPYSAIFIDMLMPEIDGWHLASEIRTNKLCSNTKLYLCVPEGQMGGEAKMKLLNWFNGYIYKPVKQQKIFQVLQEALGEKSAEKPDLNQQIAKKIHGGENSVIHGLSVLVADDHPVNRKLIVAFLEKFGAKVTQAEDGEEAVLSLRNNPDIDIVFMDIQMPNKNGIEATDEIRSTGYRGIIIACTANNDFSTVDEYEQHGFNDTLIKPFKSSKIKEILIKWQDFCIMPAELVPEEIGQDNDEFAKKTDLIQIWDLEDFIDTIGNNTQLGIKLLGDFTAQTERLIQEAQKAITENNFTLLRRIGHTISGSASSLSIFALASAAEKFNQAAKAQNINELNLKLQDIKKEFRIFWKKSQNWITESWKE